MTVKQGIEYINKIDSEIKNLQCLLKMNEEDMASLELQYGINSRIANTVNVAVNSMMAYKNLLKEKIDNTEIN